jgi:hypothetical protein
MMIEWNYPKTVEEAVRRLMAQLPLKDKVYIAGLDRKDLYLLHISLESSIMQEFGLWTGNKELIESCRVVSGRDDLSADQGSGVIIEALWRELQKTHALRLVEKGERG